MAKHSYLISEGELNAAQLEFINLRDLLRWGLTQFNKADLFYGHGTDNAWDEIIYLIVNFSMQSITLICVTFRQF